MSDAIDTLSHKSVEKFLLSLPHAWLDYPFGEGVAVYKVGEKAAGDAKTAGSSAGGGKMFALVAEKSSPVQVSLKCDPQLAEVLREKYESVMPGYHLNKKHWNTVVLTGQLPWEEVQGLISLSYQLVTEGK